MRNQEWTPEGKEQPDEQLPTVARVSKVLKNVGPRHPNGFQVPGRDDLVEPKASTVTKALDTFRPLKAPGPDGIHPVQLISGLPCSNLLGMSTTWLCTEHMRGARVIFVPKLGKKDYSMASA
ncbi:unnamed protein product [Allacma fusca]|uniref:Uncharacterized protein n=1 Tax=Allacma fusca TaxID=39272 RepID=A0A8J2NRN3_9HEXA|nr:unnamed protein product [Allacma fusca]